MDNNLKSKTLSGVIWQFSQKILGQFFSFIVTVILARLLSPSDYGVVALACMFNVLVGIFVSGSMDAALIQKKDADELDYNTIFYSSLFWNRFKILFNFAWKKTAASFIGTLCGQLKGYLIGYRYTAADLAFYNRGEGIPQMLDNNITGTINAVLFPALSKFQGDVKAVKNGIRRAMMTSSYILSPIFLGLAAVSDKIVPLLYSDKWSSAIPFMQLACLTCVVSVLNGANVQALFAIGKSGEVLKLEIYKKPVMLVLISGGIYFGPIGISAFNFLYSIYGLFVNNRPNRKWLNYSLQEQVGDVKVGILFSTAMALFVYFIGLFFKNAVLALCVQIPIGIILYISLSEFIKPEAYMYSKTTLINLFKQKFNK